MVWTYGQMNKRKLENDWLKRVFYLKDFCHEIRGLCVAQTNFSIERNVDDEKKVWQQSAPNRKKPKSNDR